MFDRSSVNTQRLVEHNPPLRTPSDATEVDSWEEKKSGLIPAHQVIGPLTHNECAAWRNNILRHHNYNCILFFPASQTTWCACQAKGGLPCRWSYQPCLQAGILAGFVSSQDPVNPSCLEPADFAPSRSTSDKQQFVWGGLTRLWGKPFLVDNRLN